jgi:type IV pilus assembly protein PilC
VPIYNYKALNDQGSVIKGTVTAQDRSRALSELSELGVFVQKLSREFTLSLGKTSLKPQEFFRLIKSLRSLLKSGLAFTECLSALAVEPENKRVAQYVNSLHLDVVNGDSFSQACLRYPEVFDEVFVSAVRTGEKSGDLFSALGNYQDYLSQKLQLNRKIKSALTYPVFLLSALGVVLAILFIYVVPNFAELFESFDAQLPKPTQWVIAAGEYAPGIIFSLLIFICSSLLLSGTLKQQLQWQRTVDQSLLRVPLIGAMRAKVQTARLASTMTNLMASGASIIEILDLTISSFRGTQLGLTLERTKTAIVDGQSVFHAFKEQSVFTGYALKMLSVGEKAAAMDRVLADIAEYQQEELDDQVERFTALLEPALILFMGVLMGFVIIAMYMPIFYMSEVVQ